MCQHHQHKQKNGSKSRNSIEANSSKFRAQLKICNLRKTIKKQIRHLSLKMRKNKSRMVFWRNLIMDSQHQDIQFQQAQTLQQYFWKIYSSSATYYQHMGCQTPLLG